MIDIKFNVTLCILGITVYLLDIKQRASPFYVKKLFGVYLSHGLHTL